MVKYQFLALRRLSKLVTLKFLSLQIRKRHFDWYPSVQLLHKLIQLDCHVVISHSVRSYFILWAPLHYDISYPRWINWCTQNAYHIFSEYVLECKKKLGEHVLKQTVYVFFYLLKIDSHNKHKVKHDNWKYFMFFFTLLYSRDLLQSNFRKSVPMLLKEFMVIHVFRSKYSGGFLVMLQVF